VVTSPSDGDAIKPDDLQNVGRGTLALQCSFRCCAMRTMSHHEARTAGFHVAKRSASQKWKDSDRV